MPLAPMTQKLATFDPDISEAVLHMTSCVAYHVAPIDLRPTMLNMIAAKCVHYEEGHHTDGLSVSPKRLEEFKLRTAQDPEMQLLTSQIQKGWP